MSKPLTLRADESLRGDCLSASELDPPSEAILDPVDAGGFAVALRLVADDVTVRGLVVQGASVGIDLSDRFSGYRVHENVIEGNALFGADFGASGERPSRVDHNCVRDNRYGLVSELDDDSLWRPMVRRPRARPE